MLEADSALAEDRYDAAKRSGRHDIEYDRHPPRLLNMPTEAFARFMSSLHLNFDRWHDGDGFDLDALAHIDEGERGDAVWELARREATWREVEALEHIDIPPAFMAIERALRDSRSIDTRLAAAAALHRLGKLDEPVDAVLAREICQLSSIEDGSTRAFLMAEEHPTDRVKQALLAATQARTECSIHCAGVLCFLNGVASEPFDWNLRPLFLRLGPDEPEADRAAAFAELCALVKMVPATE